MAPSVPEEVTFSHACRNEGIGRLMDVRGAEWALTARRSGHSMSEKMWITAKSLHRRSQHRTSVCLSSSTQMKNPQRLRAAVLGTEINKSEMKHQPSSHFTSEWVTFHHKGEQSFYPVIEGNKRHAKMQMGTNLLLFWKRLSWFNRKCWHDYNAG